MNGTRTVSETQLHGLPLLRRGKVRDVYRVDDERLLVVATDRISAFDCILPTQIPRKGEVLTALSRFWFERLAHVTPHHLITAEVGEMPEAVRRHAAILRGRSMLVRRTEVFPVECVVRGYLAGSGWKDYLATGEVCGHRLPEGLRESSELPEPIFTPATKAELGEHDENIDFDRAAQILGDRELAEQLRRLSLELYGAASAHAEQRGIILADTKFEFGRDADGGVVLADEVLTPDSSRFWPASSYEPGGSQPSFDKQFVRDWLDSTGWDHSPPGPVLPPEVVERTRSKYVEAYERIVGEPFERWAGARA